VVRSRSAATAATSDRSAVRGRASDERGVSSIELAVIAPSLILLIFLLVQGALLFYGRSVALQAARDGVSQLRLQQSAGGCEAAKPGVASNVLAYASHVGSGALTAASVTPECHYNPNGGSTVTVTVRGQAISLVGITMHITQTATGRVEQFQPNG
jgi:Flp pilus assembly protein TadG